MPRAFAKLYKLDIKRGSIRMVKALAKEAHYKACLAWLDAVVNGKGGYTDRFGTQTFPVFSGESIGSLIPVAEAIDNILGGSAAQEIVYTMIGEKLPVDMNLFNPVWRYSKNIPSMVKTYELGRSQMQVEIFADKNNAGFNLKFNSTVWQWSQAESNRLGDMSPWGRLELGKKAYKESVQLELEKIKQLINFRTLVQTTEVTEKTAAAILTKTLLED